MQGSAGTRLGFWAWGKRSFSSGAHFCDRAVGRWACLRFAGARLLSWSCRGHAGVMRWSWLVTPWSRLGRAVVMRWSCGGRGGHAVVMRWSRGGHAVVMRWSCGGHAVVSKIKGHAKGLYAVVSKIKGHAKGPYVVDSETILPQVVVDGDFLRVLHTWESRNQTNRTHKNLGLDSCVN